MSHGNAGRPVVALLLSEKTRRQVLPPEALALLHEIAAVREPAGAEIGEEELPALLDGAVAAITGWGTPPLAESLAGIANPPGLIAHTAGTIRKLVPLAAVENGLKVSHAANIIADSVAELVIGEAIVALRRVIDHDVALKAGDAWSGLLDRFPGQLLGARTVGVVGAGYVGRKVIARLQAFGCPVLVFDPYLKDEAATDLGVEKVSLDDLFARCDLVTLHAPVLPETERMVGAAQLRALPDGALFINTARAALVDEPALLAELQSGRIRAVLDVFDGDPIGPDNPFRKLPNVTITPHIAGRTDDTHLRQGLEMAREVQRFLAGEPLRYEITPAMLATMA